MTRPLWHTSACPPEFPPDSSTCAASPSSNHTELTQQATALQGILPHTSIMSTWTLDQLVDARYTQELVNSYRSERDKARRERDEHMNGESRLQQKLADAETIMKRLASTPAADSTSRD